MKALLYGLVALIGCASLSPRPESERQHFITSPIVDNALDFLYFAVAERARLEAWFCLRGFVDRRTENVVITNLSPVFVDSADGQNIHGRPADCRKGPDSLSVIGTVHFHPDFGQCEFSDIDLVTAYHLPFPIEAIMCKDHKNPRPHLRVAFRSDIDSAYKAIRRANGDGPTEPRSFKPVYVWKPE